MKFYPAIILASFVGLALGGIAGSGLALPTRSVYVVTELDQIIDPAAYDELKKSMGQSAGMEAQMADGRYLVRTEDIAPLDGVAPKAISIISFNNEAKAKEYYENIKDLRAIRMKAAKSRSFIIGVCADRGRLASNC
jgi:uncharacterized protein (DUF1330 family)